MGKNHYSKLKRANWKKFLKMDKCKEIIMVREL